MRRFVFVSVLLVVLMALVPGSASAQGGLGAPDFKDRFTDEFVDEDFCGTGASVQVVQEVAPTGGTGSMSSKGTFRVRTSLTYGDTTIYEQAAGRDYLVREGDVEGAHTELFVATGLRSLLLVPGEGTVTLDHGLIEFVLIFDENGEFVGVEVLKDAGGHPGFQSELFCDVAVAALGIPMT